eukprot:evm.model.scf_303EXC.6 EVM.evm.TU.scf_303EXC.6   scf_303EXC:97659-103117(+)
MRLLVSNRGEIAERIVRTCNRLGIETVAVYTEPDALSPHVLRATESVYLKGGPGCYMLGPRLVKIAKEMGCQAVHPGYGFLSENVEFATQCEEAGITFLGPTTDTMNVFSEKHIAKQLAQENSVPTLSGSGLLTSAEEAVASAQAVGFPVLLKATGGGGGMGIYLCYTEEELVSKFETAAKQGEAFFGNAGVFVEKYVQHAHHVEVQIFGDGKGCVVHLGERECSIQRRHQKILEETPSVLVTEDIRERLTAAAVRLCSAVKYRSAGTVEFLVDSDTKEFYFLEVNTRLQVEHGITEMVNGGVDLVEWMLRVQLEDLPAADFSPKTDLSSFTSRRSGWAIEVRVCAEDPTKDFTPSPGVLGQVAFPEDLPGVRVDTWIETGTAVSTFYDSLLGKVMVHADTREAAISMLETALAQTHIKGIPTNLGFLRSLIASEKFKSGNTTTRFLEDFEMVPDQIEVLDAGMQTTVQDYPGRVGLWHVGVPPSGAMDDFSFQLANALVGNDSKAAGLEFTLKGPTLKFTCDSLIALTGAHFEALLDEVPVPWWTSVKVQAGQVLRVKGTDGDNGVRGYLAVWGGLDVPDYLGSKSTFPGGNLGGHQGRALRVGDTINIQPVAAGLCDGVAVPLDWRPELPGLGKPWEVQVLPGPQAAPDYFVEEDIKDLYNTQYVVHYNSNRLGVRFQGPRPRWARKDGGEGGSHPSNVHDHVYAIGTINYTGDMPIVLTCDGPSLGGFVCPATIISTELWKMGQVRPNDAVVWCQTTLESAYSKCRKRKLMMRLLCSVAQGKASVDDAVAELSGAEFDVPEMPEAKAVLKRLSQWCHPGAQYRLAGDRYVLVEYGPMELDINLRVRVHMLEKWLADRKVGCSGMASMKFAVWSSV